MKTSSTSLLLSTVLLAAGLLASSPSPAAAQSWPNEPSGGTLLTDWPFNSLSGGGWGTNGGSFISTDSTAPHSPSNVLAMKYPSGYQAGGSPDIYYYGLGNRTGGIYVGFWWKASAGWQQEGNSQMSKIAFWLYSNVLGDDYIGMAGPVGGPYRININAEFPTVCNGHLPGTWGDSCYGTRVLEPNAGNGSVIPGNWYRIEIFQVPSSTPTSRDGSIMWWLNGQLAGNYSGVNFPSAAFAEFQLSPTWGGLNNTKTQNDYFWFDHVRISSGGTGGGSTKSDTIPPAVPSGLRAN